MTTYTTRTTDRQTQEDRRRAVLVTAIVERPHVGDADAEAVAAYLDPQAVRDGSALAYLLDGGAL